MTGQKEFQFHAHHTPLDIKQFIEKEKNRRQSNKVLHAHPSPMYWKELGVSTESLLQIRANYREETNLPVNLYVATPFCIKTKPAHCGFCLFPSTDYTGNTAVETYLDYLKKEFELYKPFYAQDKLASIYLGGGTPNLYRADQYGQLMGYIDKLYGGIPDDIEITIEGIPQLFTEEKIRAIKEAGITRISVGVQQLNDDLIKYSGRKQKQEQVFHTLELCEKYGLAANVDMIYGWPEQSIDQMSIDLQTLIDTGVRHITHYELNIAGRSDFASRKHRDVLPSINYNIEMYKASRDLLRANGFHQETVYDWENKQNKQQKFKQSQCNYENNLRNSVDHQHGKINAIQQMCGIGFAAINIHPNGLKASDENWTYMNHRSLPQYYEKLDKGQFPVERGFIYEHQDLKLVWLFQSMQSMKINYVDYQEIFKENLLDAYSSIWTELDNQGWLKVTGSELQLVEEGQYYIPMLQSLLSSKRLAQLRAMSKQSQGKIMLSVE